MPCGLLLVLGLRITDAHGTYGTDTESPLAEMLEEQEAIRQQYITCFLIFLSLVLFSGQKSCARVCAPVCLQTGSSSARMKLEWQSTAPS